MYSLMVRIILLIMYLVLQLQCIAPATVLCLSGVSPQPIVYGRISCSGTEQALSACSKNVYYYSDCSTT